MAVLSVAGKRRRAWWALAASIVFSTGMIAFVHLNQNKEREALHEGVIKDMERQERKRLNRIEQEQQMELRRQLELEEKRTLEQQQQQQRKSQ
ncbi:hypothetical protein PTSG_12880 [Salpingoeca rosetta]|uniref:PET117 cytochrome c oxidase chaperone n=1 Tax=Salpingoeca rosetta (strain ATCC 50818 / BSB-021) TaxID=946362 RepID=F2UMK4_SALR5|nr:uncharacterized protein PTSG_12880 [Salpingoeca rosetta]EGD78353.1 hypothetical protein PTSG_12880 [Salpingoeca rosetta]|eukprot:XP_004989676.1 hypothetical protein PTSG_12880 [Salpingoeca rosetta]